MGGDSNIDWNPMHSSLASSVDWNPQHSSIGQGLQKTGDALNNIGRGDWAAAGQDMMNSGKNWGDAALGGAAFMGGPLAWKGVGENEIKRNSASTKQDQNNEADRGNAAAAEQKRQADQAAAEKAMQQQQADLAGTSARGQANQANSLENSLQSALQLKKQRGTQMYGGM